VAHFEWPLLVFLALSIKIGQVKQKNNIGIFSSLEWPLVALSTRVLYARTID
jgi:hypothetical protein